MVLFPAQRNHELIIIICLIRHFLLPLLELIEHFFTGMDSQKTL